MKKDESGNIVTASGGSLWGSSGGQLEFVSQKVVTKKRSDGSFVVMMILRFTDHDVRHSPNENLIDGKYYEIEVPICEEET